MANLSNEGIDGNIPENRGSFVCVPVGIYEAVIVADRLTDTKNGGGKLLEMKNQIIEGPFAGTIIIDRLNIRNSSAQAAAIGQGQLKRICNICGVPFPPADTSMLYGKPMLITVKVEGFKSKTTGKDLESNKISAYDKVPDVVQAPKAAAAGGW
jgi:hypothetical protein